MQLATQEIRIMVNIESSEIQLCFFTIVPSFMEIFCVNIV